MPFSYRDETKELNDLTRKEAGGSFVQLSAGFTHYELRDPALPHLHLRPGQVSAPSPIFGLQKMGEGWGGGRDVVLVHGFSVPYFIYDPTFEFLVQSGFRAVRYDLFGRGFSDRPDTRYNIDLFIRQLRDLLDALGFTRPVSLIGLSTGGPIVAAFTDRFPERVDKLVMIDPVGAKPLPFAPLLKVMTFPLVGEAIAGLIRNDSLTSGFVGKFFDRELVTHFRSRYVVQMEYKGFRRGILSTLRNRMLDSFVDVYERIGKLDKPVLLLWGREDITVPFDHSEVLCAAIPQVQFHAFEHCGHTPHYEKPEEVNPILLQFLKD